MTNTVTDFLLKSPCANCPFRTDIEPYLRPERAQEIATGLANGGEFSCHKTTVMDDDGEELVRGPGNRFCAGAMATLEREDAPNQMMRMAESIGIYDATAMRSKDQPVYSSLAAWVNAHIRAVGPPTEFVEGVGEVELTLCGIVGTGCEAPAGYMVGGSAVANADEPYLNPYTDNCEACGEVACESCRSEEWGPDGKYCVYCTEDSDEDGEDD